MDISKNEDAELLKKIDRLRLPPILMIEIVNIQEKPALVEHFLKVSLPAELDILRLAAQDKEALSISPFMTSLKKALLYVSEELTLVNFDFTEKEFSQIVDTSSHIKSLNFVS